MHLTVGDVIRWDRFPYPRTGEIKPRWFIYLGRTTVFSTPVFAYLCTTTTNIEEFETGGARCNHASRRFEARLFPAFAQDCILDFDEEIHTVTEDILEGCRKQIDVKGHLAVDTMRNIYKQFFRPGVVSRAVMRDIHESFNRDGITGLKMPK
ncbi:MAG: hypothetical protein ABIJ25_05525 [Pseudomonadota bacterium]|nr:hypothetical protein [Pseudomonadota bacterium]